ncbi:MULTISPECIES: lysylphosphatidylglycerol synthase domain-containing protein [unclassified Zymobacter]|uniref:lysylphosphatidylglycerol synthase domain-containing protein n=1 Tax=unclassified Zymobacter TaxID=3048685 RepID=UPI0039C1FC0C
MSNLSKLSSRLMKYRHQLGVALIVAIFVGAVYACWSMVRSINLSQLHAALVAVPPQWIVGAVLAAVGSYVMLLGYEWSATRYAGVSVPSRALVMAGACASAVGNAIGLSMLSGGAVRYRLYFPHGIEPADVARMSAFVSLALGCALPPLAAVAALIHVDAAAQALHLSRSWVIGIGIAVLVGYLLLVGILATRRSAHCPTPFTRQFHLWHWRFRLPNMVLSALQLLITLLDVICASAVLYLLIPGDIPFTTFMMVYLLALATGVLSHIPGGFGVFEMIILSAFKGSVGEAPLLAAILLYRAIYVLLPLVLACLALLCCELVRLRRHRSAS